MNALLAGRSVRPVVVALVLLAGAAARAADPVPAPAELERMLREEPITLKSWKAWQPRLRAWSGTAMQATMPAFEEAFKLVRSVRFGARFGPRGRALSKDPVALMILGGSFLHDPTFEAKPVALSAEAEKALKASLKEDVRIARTHYWLAQALRTQELTPPELGGPAAPRPPRLREAHPQFAQARKLDPRLPALSPREEGQLAALGDLHSVAEEVLRPLVQGKSDAEVVRWYARAVALNGKVKDKRAPVLKPLADRFPKDGVVAVAYGYALGRDGSARLGLKEFERAQKLGTDPATVVGKDKVEQMHKAVEEADRKVAENRRQQEQQRKLQAQKQQQQQAQQQKQQQTSGEGSVFWTVMLWFFLGYGVLIGLMFLAGLLLARFTRGPRALDLLGAPPDSLVARGQVLRTTHESKLTKLYCLGLVLALIFFYAAIPFVLWGMLILFLIVLLLTFFLRRDPDMAELHTDMVKASGGGMWEVIKALFASFGKGSFGIPKTPDDCPRLYEVLREVARRVDTEPVDEVYLSPGAMLCVHQEGRGPFGIFGGRRRVLTLGVSVMHFLTVNQLKSILAHEYAHFSHKDTFYSRFIYQVSLSIKTAMRGMARAGGWLTYINPFYWFFYLYSKAYALMAAGYSRSREFLADRMAVSLYGSDVFALALETACIDGRMFEESAHDNISELLRRKKVFENMYFFFCRYRDQLANSPERAKRRRELMNEKESLFDSHPTFAERLAAVQSLPKAEKTDTETAMTLFEEPEEVQKEMTQFLTAVINYSRRR
jgi:Zn-dependent protease with chaperone function